MLGSSDLVVSTADGADEKGGGSGGEFYDGDRSTGGNRWPRQETLALLKIRSDMDAAFRDSSLKGPLWEEISRKMAELGYHRSGKKCKEKFENVYKYHKRTKEGRVAKADGKTYRFFDQLEAFDHHHHHQQHQSNYSSLPQPPPDEEAVPVTMVMPASAIHHHVTVTSSGCSTTPHLPINIIHQQQINNNNNNPMMNHIPQPQMPVVVQPQPAIGVEQERIPTSLLRSASATPSSSSSTDVDEEVVGSRKRKRKWKGLFERMAREVINKQEELHRRFMEVVEKRENDRVAREEAWKMQELARLKREHQSLVEERSMASAKDAALISFLQKIAEQRNIPFPLSLQVQIQPHPQPPQLPPQHPPQVQKPHPLTEEQKMALSKIINGENHQSKEILAPSRWPKAEVQALINLRTSMEAKYQENNPKGPLWEDISAAMKKIGYNRNAKRCKEKWENINKYFKKVKEGNRKRREDSKTCPYFDQLDALYRQKKTPAASVATAVTASAAVGDTFGPESEEYEDDDEEEEEEEEEEEDEGNGYEIVANTATATTATTTATAG